jgi:hypothetical protein
MEVRVLQKYETYTPDPGMVRWMRVALERAAGIDVDAWERGWLELMAVGAMDWVSLCGWWLWKATGVHPTRDHYEHVFVQDGGYALQPEHLMIFQYFMEKNEFNLRAKEPVLYELEIGECVPFVRELYFEMNQVSPPPSAALELGIWAGLLYLTSDNARPWLKDVNPIFGSVYDFGVAYYYKAGQGGWTVLDPQTVERSDRQVGCCSRCGTSLYCVSPHIINSGQGYEAYMPMCDACAHDITRRTIPLTIDDWRCPSLGGRCGNIECPYNTADPDDFWEVLKQMGSQRVAREVEHARVSGTTRRMLQGQTLDTIVDMFD